MSVLGVFLGSFWCRFGLGSAQKWSEDAVHFSRAFLDAFWGGFWDDFGGLLG